MADTSGGTNGTNDSPNRATVALVDAKLDGLRELTRAEFRGLQDKLEPLAGLPVTVTAMRGELNNLKRRVTDIEEARQAEEDGAKAWRRIHLPTLLLTAVLAIAAIVTIVTQVH